MVQLLEVILIEVVEEPARADRMRRDLEIVNVAVPVLAYAIDVCTVDALRHGGHYTIAGGHGPRYDADQDAMTRDLGRLTARTFDVLVVGGGIYGLTIAYDCAQRGLSVALIDRGDFGSGASFNHLRTIHGGLRYLQTLDIGRARESVRERRTLARIAPDAVRLQPFVLPLSALADSRNERRCAPGSRSIGFVAFDRNQGVSAGPAAARRHGPVARRDRPSLSEPRCAGPDRRGHVARLRQHRIRSAHAQLRTRGCRMQRGARQLRGRDRAPERRRPRVGCPRRRRPERPGARDRGACHGERRGRRRQRLARRHRRIRPSRSCRP